MIVKSAYRFVSIFIGCMIAFKIIMPPSVSLSTWENSFLYYTQETVFTWGFVLNWAIAVAAYYLATNFLLKNTNKKSLIIAATTFFVSVFVFMKLRPSNTTLSPAIVGPFIGMLILGLPSLFGLVRTAGQGAERREEAFRRCGVNANIALFAASTLAGLLLLEGALRLYNPVVIRVRGETIVLQTLTKEVIHNTHPGKMEEWIVHTTNSLGFRGAEPPIPFDRALTAVAVGGSTTEDAFLSDQTTWVAQAYSILKPVFPDLWMNNAGLAGHSTTAHALLIRDYLAKLKPDYVLILCGINDFAKDALMSTESAIRLYENGMMRRDNVLRPVLDRLADYSELANLLNVMRRSYEANRAGLGNYDLGRSGRIVVDRRVPVNEADYIVLNERLAAHRQAYAGRLKGLADQVAQWGGRVVFVTQPLLWGGGTDADTGMNLDDPRELLGGVETSGKVMWRLLDDYNNVVRGFVRDADAALIDLAALMPKRSGLFYDSMHFSPAGSALVGRLVAAEFCRILKERDAPSATECPQP